MTKKSQKMIRAGVVGASGYSGMEACKLLLKHPHVRLTYVSANNTTGPLTTIWPELNGQTKLVCHKFDLKSAVELTDVVFLAVPHTIAMDIVPKLLQEGKRVIDISGDYRLNNASSYKKWYGATHKDVQNLTKAVYGLPELYREKIKNADLVSNPGCYPTAALLGLLPLVSTHAKSIKSIIIDAKSGVSGAGRKVATELLMSEMVENFKAYKVSQHQHKPEIEQYLTKVGKQKVKVNFVPHLLPINRGILETIYVDCGNKLTVKKVYSIYNKFYKTEKYVRVLEVGIQPEIKNVAITNYCDIGFAKNENLLVITSVIDNLTKGASGQAVQNMNIMYGFEENEGLL